MTNVIVFKGFELTGIEGVSVEQFMHVIERLNESIGLNEAIDFVKNEESITTGITYRDTANHHYPFALQLNGGGQLLIIEPDWFEDEEEEIDLFWGMLRKHFGVDNF